MRHRIAALAIGLVAALAATTTWAQCPQGGGGGGGGGGTNLRGMSSAGRMLASRPGGRFSSAVMETVMAHFARGGRMMGGGGMSGMQQMPAKQTKRKRRGPTTGLSARRLAELQKRQRTYERSANQSSRSSAEERAAQYNASAERARERGQMRVALAFYRLAARSGDSLEADLAKVQIERMTKK